MERYQGSQRDYIIYGFTVRQRYQLDFLTNNTFEEDAMRIDRKLNVAMTRARLHMLMVATPRCCDRTRRSADSSTSPSTAEPTTTYRWTNIAQATSP